MINGHDQFAVFLGLDVGKGEHHAVAQSRPGKKLLDRALPNDEAKLRELYRRLRKHGPVLLVVDQPATIGALPVAVALDEGITVAYLPGLAMRRIADLHPGSAKTDLLTELPDRILGSSPRPPLAVARLRAHGQRRGCAAGVVAVGGAAERVA